MYFTKAQEPIIVHMTDTNRPMYIEIGLKNDENVTDTYQFYFSIYLLSNPISMCPNLYNNRLGSWALVELKCLTYLSTEAGEPTKSFLLFGE